MSEGNRDRGEMQSEGGREEEGRDGKREMGTDRLSETKQQKSRAKQMDREKIQTFERKE